MAAAAAVLRSVSTQCIRCSLENSPSQANAEIRARLAIDDVQDVQEAEDVEAETNSQDG